MKAPHLRLVRDVDAQARSDAKWERELDIARAAESLALLSRRCPPSQRRHFEAALRSISAALREDEGNGAA